VSSTPATSRCSGGLPRGAQDTQRPYLAKLVANDDVITLVSDHVGQVTGFLIATLTSAPGVYDPGGFTCQIDDFAVAPVEKWSTTTAKLLRAGLAEAGRRGAIQAVVGTSISPSARRCKPAGSKSPPNGG